MPALEFDLLLLLLRLLRKLGLLAVLALEKGETHRTIMRKLVIKFPCYKSTPYTIIILTSSPSEFNILFVLEEFPSHALDCGVPPSCARSNVGGEVFLGDLEQVIRIAVPVVDNIVPNEAL